MHREMRILRIAHDIVGHFDREISRKIRILIAGPHFRVNEQAKVRIINLTDRRALVQQQLQLSP